MRQRRSISVRMRHPDEFRAGAEATLGHNLVCWRAAEERERNPEAGQEMKDGTVFAGVDPKTGRKIFAAPRDENILVAFNEASACAQMRSAEKYLGHGDWEVPSRAVLEVLYENRHKGVLAGTFQETHDQDGRSSFYWSAALFDAFHAYGRFFDLGVDVSSIAVYKQSVRLVRSPR